MHLVYHSSESLGYMSLILIQMTPTTIPPDLSLVHLRVSVEGVTLEKTFEGDPLLKYTFSWNRRNAFNQKVYGIVTARGESFVVVFWILYILILSLQKFMERETEVVKDLWLFEGI